MRGRKSEQERGKSKEDGSGSEHSEVKETRKELVQPDGHPKATRR